MEKKAPRSFSWQFKEEVAKRMLNGESPTLLSRELRIVLSKLYQWRDADVNKKKRRPCATNCKCAA